MTVDTAQTGVTAVLPPSGQPQSVADNIPDPNAPNNTGISVPPTDPNIPSGAIPDSIQPTQVPANTQVQNTPQQPAPQGSMQSPQQPPPAPKGVSPNDPNANHPAVQAAGRVNSILNAILPPRVKTTIDVNTGETTKTPVPRTRGDIAMAIALEAISGGLAGLQGKGPNRFGQAAAAGLEQGQQIEAKRKAEDQQQANEASADYARHAAILETNLKMWQNAHTIGRQDLETNQAYVAPHRAVVDRLQKEAPGIITDIVSEQDLAKHHVTKANAIPYEVVPRPDPNQPDGQARGKFGERQWDINYAIVDPNYKITNVLSPKEIKVLQDIKAPGFANGEGGPVNIPDNVELKLYQWLGLKAQANAFMMAQDETQNMADDINKYGNGGTGSFAFNTKPVSLPTHAYDDIIHNASLKTGVDENIIKAVIMRESGGDPNVKPGTSGEIGLMQLLPSTSQELGVTNPQDPQQNIDGGARYLAEQLGRFNGNARLALAAYNGGPNNVIAAGNQVPAKNQDYVNNVSSIAGLTNPQGTAQNPAGSGPIKPADLIAAAQNDRTFAQAVTAWQKYWGRFPTHTQDMNAFAKDDPDNYTKMQRVLGPDTVRQYDEAIKQRERLVTDADTERRANIERQDKESEKSADYAEVAKDIAGDPNDPGSGDLTQLDKLISQRTADRPKVYAAIKRINPNWNPAVAEQKLEVWKGFTEPAGRSTQQVTSFNALMQHIGQGITVNDEYRRQNSPLLNKPYNWLQANVKNNPQVAEFMAAEAPIKSEFLNLLNNNHALHDADKEEGAALVNAAQTPKEFEQVMKTIGATAAVRIKAVNSQWNRVFGQGHNVPGLIDPDTVPAIAKLTDATGKNETADILRDMDTGGMITGDPTGRGVPGKTLAQALGRTVQPNGLTTQSQFQFTTKDGKMGWNGNSWVPTGR